MSRARWFAPIVCAFAVMVPAGSAGASTAPPDCTGTSATMHFSPPLQMQASGTPEVVTLDIAGSNCGAHGNPTTIQSVVASLTFPGRRLDSCRALFAPKGWQQTTAATGRVRYQPAGNPASSLRGATLTLGPADRPNEAFLRVAGDVVKGSFAGDRYSLYMLPDHGVAELRHDCTHGGLAEMQAGATIFAIG